MLSNPAPVVTAFSGSNNGFVVDFSESIDPDVLNLYDGESGVFGPPDVTLVGKNVGPIAGSLVIDDGRGITVVRFILVQPRPRLVNMPGRHVE